eukprot:CAMPEP_0115301736 /NCGR_PEP_ID=MMETSP0270-20121206/70015_1 /TAXON_ID=71861 /ORGANISM="Scrippsiella trochoidea, Strain CCMP3099" /LENGTH=272 /DNA_ID=CAMNT_0002719629 /DNA_START=177 /DNA_END=993 /DNA_ORIENTATION=+
MAALYLALDLLTPVGEKSASPTSAHSAPFSSALTALLLTVVALWLMDAALVCLYKKKLTAAEDSGRPAAELPALTRWQMVCVFSSSLALFVYAARLLLKLYAFWLEFGQQAVLTQVITNGLILLLKVMKVLALHSFSTWLRVCWGAARDRPLPGGRATSMAMVKAWQLARLHGEGSQHMAWPDDANRAATPLLVQNIDPWVCFPLQHHSIDSEATGGIWLRSWSRVSEGVQSIWAEACLVQVGIGSAHFGARMWLTGQDGSFQQRRMGRTCK